MLEYTNRALPIVERSVIDLLQGESIHLMLRQLTEEDLTELTALRTREEADGAERQRAHVALTELFPRLFLHAPWHHPDLPSLVSVDSDGRLTGMASRGVRPMLFRGQPITAAVDADLYVDEAARKSLAGVMLLRELLDGPQDVTISDVANNNTRQLWERLGGFVAPAYNLNWIGVLRPCQLAAAMLANRRGGTIPAHLVRLLARVVDRFAPDGVRCLVTSVPRGLTESTLTPQDFSEHVQELTQEESVQPVYSPGAAEWMWKRLPYLSPESGEVSTVLIRNSRGRLLGWYIYLLESGGVARVMQIAARSVDAEAVVGHLFARLDDEGAAAVTGRMQPRFQQLLIDRGCLLRGRERYTLIHSRNSEIADAFRSGQAWLSPLEGEAPLNIWHRPESAIVDLSGLTRSPRRFAVVDSTPAQH